MWWVLDSKLRPSLTLAQISHPWSRLPSLNNRKLYLAHVRHTLEELIKLVNSLSNHDQSWDALV